MNRIFQEKFRKLLSPRDGDPPRGGAPPATSIIIVLMLILLVAAGLAHAFTELVHG